MSRAPQRQDRSDCQARRLHLRVSRFIHRLWDDDQSDPTTTADSIPNVSKLCAFGLTDRTTVNQEHSTITVRQAKNHLTEPLSQFGRVPVLAKTLDLNSYRTNLAVPQHDVETIIGTQSSDVWTDLLLTELVPHFG